MGIRLAKEDEIQGLDLAGIIYDMERRNKKELLLFLLAHGESWEVAATRAVSTLVKKVLQEQSNTKQDGHENGNFELHYTPSNANQKSFKVTLPNKPKSPNQVSSYVTNDTQQESMTSKI
jgi:hypothetical protein